MQLGMIGLGKMGFNLVRNMLSHRHEVIAYDVSPEPAKELASYGAIPATTIEELVGKLHKPRTVWMMVPAGKIVDQVIDQVIPYLEPGDIVIDGGNSHYKDTLSRGERLQTQGIHYMDAGTSGGTSGALEGGCFMVGGSPEAWDHVKDMFHDLSVEKGCLYTGKVGSGHFLKMIHNGIEYGMMQAIAEGFEILDKSQFDYNFEEVSRVWANGSVIRGWLMDLMENAFSKDPKLEQIRGVMNSSGEGQWTVETALDLKANAPVIALSMFMRFRSLEDDTFHGKVVAALRNEFGGHAVVKK
ncbi:phosphogluconate dehydrogenase (NAD(+)-dependent, decarboxylating) [Thermoactinomyces sp. DSM 45892]|uniref:phosphogluconate dehydrogenase (NAD(+)-dependent, decarboxylating) n=1 Tax=Thermoactinomyces sp. DSM 45892 TaxID=1882753 RepID=UPI00089C2231|nr:decarboxylating 6-phosphogluconate dehydrogenase [Thermoactinomyces sp. DSM 45892]SDZ20158.1 6-phosphogluconate dehydrogenase [Thermoactinomyces sp. DSM 45892]